MGLFDENTGGLVTYWRTISAITSLVGTSGNARIWPGAAREGKPAPYIVYVRAPGGDVFRYLSGTSGTRATVVHIYCWADTPSGADALLELVKQSMQSGFARATWAGTYINAVYILDAPDDGYDKPLDSSDDKKHWVRLVLRIVHSET